MIRSFTLRVNGRVARLEADDDAPLVHVLRNDLGLNGPKVGCDGAQCGACAVLRNGIEIPSCVTPLSAADGCDIITSEGLDATPHGRTLRQAFFDEQASQCGYCIPGMAIAAAALLGQNASPSESQIKTAMDRHICRCGTHVRIVAAVRRAATAGQGVPNTPSPSAGRVAYGSDPRAVAPGKGDSWIEVSRDGTVTAYSGKIDMGTGIRTAYAQLVADELDVAVDKVRVVLGDTATTPNQGKSTASAGVMFGGQPLKVAARETRTALMARAAERLGVELARLEVEDGVVFDKAAPGNRVSYGDLIGNSPLAVEIDVGRTTIWGPELTASSALKAPQSYRYVGKSILRDAIADHVSGTLEYVHNVRVPGMLHGRPVRPPSYEAKLVSIDESSIAHIPDVQVVRRGAFVGVVAAREENAIQGARQLNVQWTTTNTLYDESRQFEELRKTEAVEEQVNFESGDMATALAKAERRFKSDYNVAYQLHAMLGPSCAVADVRADGATIWSGSQWPNGDRADLAQMLGLPVENVRLVWREAAGSYGRLGCDDAAADAAILSQSVGKPVRVQWTREDENAWEPVSAAATISVEAAFGADGRVEAFDYRQWSSSHSSAERGSYVAWKLIGTAPGCDRLSGEIHSLEYQVPHKRGRSIFVQPTFRTIYLRGPGGFQSHFATESFMDELALMANADPVEFRLRHLADSRDRDVLNAVARLARWTPRSGRKQISRDERMLRGRGVAFARYGVRDTFIAMVADVAVDRETGRVAVERVFVAQDCGLIVNPDGVLNQVQGNVIHAASRALKEELHYSEARATSLDWYRYPVLRFSEIPEIHVELIQRLDMPPSVVGEIATMPTGAAVANAIFDATGKRMRTAPFTPDRVRNCPSVYDT
jgi:nicotinate dehydrogenase subunit B